jgi:TnpA family transposase
VASIERTAYPRLKRHFIRKELTDAYTPTLQEIEFARTVSRGPGAVLSFVVTLKVFQRLGYFLAPARIPVVIVNHVSSCLQIPPDTRPDSSLRSDRRYQQKIRTYLNISPYGKQSRHIAVKAVSEAALVMDNPADLINVAIEELIKQRYELPAFSTLDRMAGRIRALVNGRIFHELHGRLSVEQLSRLDALLETDPQTQRSLFNLLKELPKRATLKHIHELQEKLSWLQSFQDINSLLVGASPAKVRHLAAEAKALDVNGMRAVSAPKRYALLMSLVRRAQISARDNLIEMFLKKMSRVHRQGQDELLLLKERQRTIAENLIETMSSVLIISDQRKDDAAVGKQVRALLNRNGGTRKLLNDCAAVTAYHGNNYFPLLWKFFKSFRPLLFNMLQLLKIQSATQDRLLTNAVNYLLENKDRRHYWIAPLIDVSFASEQWQRSLWIREDGREVLDRRNLEICVCSYLASELKTGDLYVEGSENYANYNEQLLTWEVCEAQVATYCEELGFPDSAAGFVEQLKQWLTEVADEVDSGYPENGQVVITEKGEPVLKRVRRTPESRELTALEAAIIDRLPERKLIDVLCNVEHWTNWTRHFGPLSGSDPKLENPRERYLVTTFGYGCNLGPWQTARHMGGLVTPHMLSFVNRRHITGQKLDAALRDIINSYSLCALPRFWGSGASAAADGTKYDLYEENLISEYHIRYGSYGGIAYHHVSDLYIALFSHFIACGVWEAVYIIDGLLKNTSEIQPDTLHADTQGQSTPVFALAHLLGIKLMPRIRNWKDLIFYRPKKDSTYQHIDPLFRDVINWELIETHWQDLFRVVLSIKAGRIFPSTLLRKLGNGSRKNKLYQAFRELGRVVRTAFLLRYIADIGLREQITASTNKVEAYHGFSKWFFFGGEGIISENDPEEQEKRIKYNDLVANAVILHNAVDMTRIIRGLHAEGQKISRETLSQLSPYLTRHISRFGDYIVDLSRQPQPLHEESELLV